MKLSELDTEHGLDVLCEITPYIGNISADEEFISELRSKVKLPPDASRAQVLMVGVQKANKLVPLVLKKHREDAFGILAGINGTDVETVRRQNFLTTCKQVTDLLSDKEFMSFFK